MLVPCIEFEVSAAEAVSLERLAGWTLSALGARVWLTEENDDRDIWLLPGERHVISDPGRVVVESWPATSAVSTAKIRLAPPAASGRIKWYPPKLPLHGAAMAGS